ncbi:MAG: helix-turn-helix transcriptional regulator [Cyanothece sp. SIO2G6]|nr:helix-turn-helix transcriptional regulator [Cyanothece sp. SIO2G6]
MNVSLFLTDIQQATQKFQQQVRGNHQSQNKETVLLLPEMLGQGCVRVIHLRDGLALFVHEYDLNQDLVLDFRKLSPRYSVINLVFCTSGRCRGTIPGLRNKLDLSAGQTMFATVPHAAGTTELLAGEKISIVELTIAPQYMLTLVESNLNALPTDWQQGLKRATTDPCFQLTHTTTAIEPVLQAIIHCPHQGRVRQLYLEGKALELIALYLTQLMNSPSTPTALIKVKQKEIDSLHHAKTLLLNNMNNPPSLADLAQQVGMSERKLQQGFQQIFGTTVFGVLHQHRMERARRLIEANHMTIEAIANTVGISHRGYFATAFKRQFGSTPREYFKRLSS